MRPETNRLSKFIASACTAASAAAPDTAPLVFGTREGVKISGEAKTWRITGDSGHEKEHAFCPTCGTPVYLTFAPNPDMIAIHAGSLDDASAFKPQAVTYTIRALPWDPLDPALQTFERMPDKG